MSNRLFLLCAAASLACFTMCTDKPEPEPQPDPDETVVLSTPVLSASVSSVEVSEANLDSEALKLSWTSAVPEGKSAEVSYVVYAGLASADLYANPNTFNAGSALSYSFKGSDLNALLLKVGVEEGGKGELQFAVYAKPASSDIESTVSSAVKVSAQSYAEKIEVPEVLYIVGTATEAVWDTSKGIPMTRNDKGIHRAEGVNINVAISDTGFKFYFSNDGSSSFFFGPDRKSETFGAAILYKEDDGTANLFQPALNGYNSGVYTIEFDAAALMMTMTRTGDLQQGAIELGESIWPLGGCFEWSWSFVDGNQMAKIADNVYELKNAKCNWGDKGDSGFKIFTEKNKWMPYFAQTEDAAKDNIKIQLVSDSEVPQFYPGLLGYENGIYDIKADFNEMVLTLTFIEGLGTSSDDALYLVGGLNNGTKDWSIDEKNATYSVGDGIYKSRTPITLGEWPYFKIASADWSKEFVRDQKAENYWTFTERVKEPTDNDCNFQPGDHDYSMHSGGIYNVTIDLNTKTITLENANKVDFDESKAIYLFGEGFPDGINDWSFDNRNALVEGESGVYTSYQPIKLLASSSFKFDKRDWTEWVRSQAEGAEYWTVTPRVKEPEDNDCGFNPGAAGLADGTYNVTLNLNTNKVTLVKID